MSAGLGAPREQIVGEHAGAEDLQGSPPHCVCPRHGPVVRAPWNEWVALAGEVAPEQRGGQEVGCRAPEVPLTPSLPWPGLSCSQAVPSGCRWLLRTEGCFQRRRPGLCGETLRLPKMTAGVLCSTAAFPFPEGFCAEAVVTSVALCFVVERGGRLSLPELPVHGFSLSSGSWRVLLLSLGISNHCGFLLVVPVCATAAPPAPGWSLLKQKRRFPNRIKLASLLRRDKQQAALLYFKNINVKRG